MARLTVAGHSVHAIINDWPIGLFSTSLVFDVLHVATKNPVFARVGYYMLASGYATGALAAASGIADYKALEKKGEVKRLANRHAQLNSAIMVLMGISLFARRKNKDTVGAGSMALSLASNALTILSAWYGDEMVYGHGVRVRDIGIKPDDHEIKMPGDKKIADALYKGISPSGSYAR